MNYTGLREGDADFGYISSGDINGNGLIDAYDISTVATRLNGGIEDFGPDSLLIGGMITAHLPKQQYKVGEVVELEIKGHDLAAVNAFSFALLYDQQDFEYAGIEPVHLKQMENLTYDRLHTNGRKSLYPTFVNLGDQETLDGNELLFIIRLKAKRNAKFIPSVTDIILVDKRLEVKK